MTDQTRQTTEVQDKLMSVGDLCKLLNVNREAIDRAKRKGLPFIKLPHSNRVYFSEHSVNQWIKSYEQKLA